MGFTKLYRQIFMGIAAGLCSCSVAIGQSADSTWTFTQCVERAFTHSPLLKIRQNTVRQNNIDYHRAQWDLLPSVEANSNWTMYFNRSTNQDNQISGGDNYAGYYGLSASMDLFGGGAKLRAIRMANLLMKQSQVQEQTQKLTLYMEVLQAYINVLYYKGIEAHAIEQLTTADEELSRVKMLVEVGRAPQSMITEMEATVSGYSLSLTQSTGQRIMAVNTLKYLLALPFKSSCEIDDHDMVIRLPETVDIGPDSVYRLACEHYPRLKEQQMQVLAVKQQLNIARASRLPQLYVSGSYGSHFYSTDKDDQGNVTSFNNQLDKYFNPTAGVSLSVPLFSGKLRTSNIRKGKLALESARYGLENEQLTVMKEINEVWLNIDTQHKAFVSASAYVKFMVKSFEAVREKFTLGLVDITEYDLAQLKLTEAYNKLLSARLNWAVQRQLLDLYCGSPALN